MANGDGSNANLVFIIAMVIHFADGLMDYNVFGFRFPAYVGMIFVLYFLYFKYKFDNWHTGVLYSILLSFLAFFIPYALLSSNLVFLNINMAGVLTKIVSLGTLRIIVNVFPAFFLYFVFIEPETDFLMKIRKIYLIILVIAFVMWIYAAVESGSISEIPALESGVGSDFLGSWQHFWKLCSNAIGDLVRAVYNMFAALATGVQKTQQGMIKYAVGDAYAGEVDKKAEEKLGVYLTPIKSSAPSFYPYELVSVYTTLTATTLEEDSAVHITLGCTADKNLPEKKILAVGANGGVNPPEIPGATRYTEQDIDCFFNPKVLSAGSHQISISAKFNFETLAYMKSYFIESSRALALKREKIDILTHYDIEDKTPKSVYTNGPVEIGMDLKQPPIEIDSTKTTEKITLGITLKNKWKGVINRLTSFKIILPGYMEIENNKCGGYLFNSIEENVYELQNLANIPEIKQYVTFRCPIVIKNPEEVLGTTPISTKYFKVDTQYDYTIDKSTNINVKKEEQTGAG